MLPLGLPAAGIIFFRPTSGRLCTDLNHLLPSERNSATLLLVQHTCRISVKLFLINDAVFRNCAPSCSTIFGCRPKMNVKQKAATIKRQTPTNGPLHAYPMEVPYIPRAPLLTCLLSMPGACSGELASHLLGPL